MKSTRVNIEIGGHGTQWQLTEPVRALIFLDRTHFATELRGSAHGLQQRFPPRTTTGRRSPRLPPEVARECRSNSLNINDQRPEVAPAGRAVGRTAAAYSAASRIALSRVSCALNGADFSGLLRMMIARLRTRRISHIRHFHAENTEAGPIRLRSKSIDRARQPTARQVGVSPCSSAPMAPGPRRSPPISSRRRRSGSTRSRSTATPSIGRSRSRRSRAAPSSTAASRAASRSPSQPTTTIASTSARACTNTAAAPSRSTAEPSSSPISPISGYTARILASSRARSRRFRRRGRRTRFAMPTACSTGAAAGSYASAKTILGKARPSMRWSASIFRARSRQKASSRGKTSFPRPA